METTLLVSLSHRLRSLTGRLKYAVAAFLSAIREVLIRILFKTQERLLNQLTS